MPHLALPLQRLAQLQLQVFALLVQGLQPLLVLCKLRGESCDGTLQAVALVVLGEPPADNGVGRWGRRGWVWRNKHPRDNWLD